MRLLAKIPDQTLTAAIRPAEFRAAREILRCRSEILVRAAGNLHGTLLGTFSEILEIADNTLCHAPHGPSRETY
jgi:hypothetical protein